MKKIMFAVALLAVISMSGMVGAQHQPADIVISKTQVSSRETRDPHTEEINRLKKQIAELKRQHKQDKKSWDWEMQQIIAMYMSENETLKARIKELEAQLEPTPEPTPEPSVEAVG